MTKRLSVLVQIPAALATLGLASACASRPADVPVNYMQGTPLDRNPVTVKSKTEFLEVRVPADARGLNDLDRRKIEQFVVDYRKVGSGPLVMSMPVDAGNASSSVRAFAEARQIAFATGVAYVDIASGEYSAAGERDAPIILAYSAYDAVAPNCLSLSRIDMAETNSNNETPTLGCAVRTNFAAMLADPSDLLGEREISDGDIDRRQSQIEMYREGAPTGASRSDDERASVSGN